MIKSVLKLSFTQSHVVSKYPNVCSISPVIVPRHPLGPVSVRLSHRTRDSAVTSKEIHQVLIPCSAQVATQTTKGVGGLI